MKTVACEQLSRGESLDLLALANLGQLVLTRRALPAAVPVRYLVDEDRVLVHVMTAPDPLPWQDGDVVTLHVSAFDADQRSGWSVSVTGRVRGTPDLSAAHERPNAPWIPDGGGDLIELFAEIVEGERLGTPTQNDAISDTP